MTWVADYSLCSRPQCNPLASSSAEEGNESLLARREWKDEQRKSSNHLPSSDIDQVFLLATADSSPSSM